MTLNCFAVIIALIKLQVIVSYA